MWKGEVAVMGMNCELLCCEQLVHSGKRAKQSIFYFLYGLFPFFLLRCSSELRDCLPSWL